MRFPTLLVFALLFLATAALGDRILLRDGRRFEGTLKSKSATEVVFETRFGVMRFPADEVVEIELGKTPRQEFDERWKGCTSAADFYALGVWADEAKIKAQARKAMKKARALDPEHEGANRWLGYVLHRGRWVTAKERDRLLAEEEAADMRKRGLVRHGDRWVSAEEKARLEAGLVYHEGRWMTPEEAKRAQGLVLYDGVWIEAHRARAQTHAAVVFEAAGAQGHVFLGPDFALAGPFDERFLAPIGAGLVRGRAWFDERFDCPSGIDLLGGRAAEFYVWGRADAHYLDSVEHLISLTTTAPKGWTEAVKRTHGFIYWDPFCLSSARVWGRPQEDLAGHCYHHWGHLLLNRHRYDGRLLPPWFDEGFAALVEYEVHGRNAVFCLGSPAAAEHIGPTATTKVETVFDTKLFRRGIWRETLITALENGDRRLTHFDHLARRQFGELSLIEIAMSMGIVSWLESRGEGTLERFHASLRKSAPRAPQRVLLKGAARQARYDAAFQEAVGSGWRGADRAWRSWFLEEERER